VLGGVALLGALPMAIYSLVTFSPTSPELFKESQRVLAEIRIPHHTLIPRWFDFIAGLQLTAIGVAMVLTWRTRLFYLIAIPTLLSIALTLVQWAIANPTLSLLFPWRASSVLVPIATTVILTRLICALPTMRLSPWCWGVASALTVASGVVVQVTGLGFRTNDRELPTLDYIRDHKQPEDVYLIPVHMPASGSGTRGSISATYLPPPGSKDKNLIAVDLQRFRLYTGAPIYVDFKSMPYKDVDVLEWLRRMKQCQEWYARNDWNNPVVRDELRREGITHIVIQADRPIDASGYRRAYDDGYYRIYHFE
jgi:hypothetical protein